MALNNRLLVTSLNTSAINIAISRPSISAILVTPLLASNDNILLLDIPNLKEIKVEMVETLKIRIVPKFKGN